MRGPIEVPSLWKAAGIGVSTSALFYGLSLIPAYTPKDAPNPSAWAILPAIFMFAAGIVLYIFTATVEREAKDLGTDRIKLLAEKIRHADRRTPTEAETESSHSKAALDPSQQLVSGDLKPSGNLGHGRDP
jgi:hypothetical protein